MTLETLASAATSLSDVLDKRSVLETTLLKWIDKQLTAKTASLDKIRLLTRSSGRELLSSMLSFLPEASVRKVAKNLDPRNDTLSNLGASQIKAHIVALATGAADPISKAIKATVRKSSASPKKKAPARARDILVDSKY
jgi:hypothetical protein